MRTLLVAAEIAGAQVPSIDVADCTNIDLQTAFDHVGHSLGRRYILRRPFPSRAVYIDIRCRRKPSTASAHSAPDFDVAENRPMQCGARPRHRRQSCNPQISIDLAVRFRARWSFARADDITFAGKPFPAVAAMIEVRLHG